MNTSILGKRGRAKEVQHGRGELLEPLTQGNSMTYKEKIRVLAKVQIGVCILGWIVAIIIVLTLMS